MFDYGIFINDILSTLTYVLLGLSLLSLWLGRGYIYSGPLFILSVVSGFLSSRLGSLSIIIILLLAALTYGFYKVKMQGSLRALCGLVITVLAAALFFHVLPGFNNWKIVSGVVISKSAAPFSLYLNFDKTMVALFLLGVGNNLAAGKRDFTAAIKKAWLPAAGGIAVTVFTAFLLGYVTTDIKFPEIIYIWAIRNLVFVCVAEEALFRGFLQKELSGVLPGNKTGRYVGILIAAVLFGLYHYQGGVKYILLAGIAGFFYGLVYHRTKSIEAAILTHFFLNLVHFVFLTYPALA